jgi:hypothetical protein
MDRVQTDITARHCAYEYYENSDWEAVVAFLVDIDFDYEEASRFVKEHKDLILKYRDELVDWLETPLREDWPR